MYPVYVNESGTTLPQEGEYYVVAGNGIWFRKDTTLFTGFIPVPSVSCLDDLDITGNTVKCNLPKVPHPLVLKIKKFFTTVFRRYHGEACILLYYDNEAQQYTVVVPRQWVTHGSVEYIRPSLSHKSNGLAVGTIHSHCDFGAFHSGTDHQDETTFDGLHVTFGDITAQSGMTVSASVVINGMRCRVDPLAFLEGVTTDDHRIYKIAQPSWEAPDYEAALSEVNGWMVKVNNGTQPFPWTDDGIRNGRSEMDTKRIKVIGLGGIGSYLVEPLCRYLSHQKEYIEMTLVDGDTYESRNRERQQFATVGNKATVTAAAMRERFPELHFRDKPEYVTEETVTSLIRENDIVFLCVDNHATRKVVSDRCEELENVALISGGNDEHDGNVIYYLRRNGEDITKSPTALDDAIKQPQDFNPGVHEEGCEARAAAQPQLLFMNLAIASMMCNIYRTHENGKTDFHQVYVDIDTLRAKPSPETF